MHKEKSFTRDLYPCYEAFSKYYPEKESEMRRALEWVINPTPEKNEIFDFIDDFGVWLKGEIDSL